MVDFARFYSQIKAVCAIVTDDCTGGGNPTTTMHFRLENMQTKTGGQQLTSLPSSSLKLDSRSSWTQCLTLEFLPHLSRDLPTIRFNLLKGKIPVKIDILVVRTK